jgi:hypothetical protein
MAACWYVDESVYTGTRFTPLTKRVLAYVRHTSWPELDGMGMRVTVNEEPSLRVAALRMSALSSRMPLFVKSCDDLYSPSTMLLLDDSLANMSEWVVPSF